MIRDERQRVTSGEQSEHHQAASMITASLASTIRREPCEHSQDEQRESYSRRAPVRANASPSLESRTRTRCGCLASLFSRDGEPGPDHFDREVFGVQGSGSGGVKRTRRWRWIKRERRV